MRIVLLAHEKFSPKDAKTAHCVLRYAKLGWSGDEVAAIIDRSKVGRDAADFVGDVGRGVPIVATLADALPLRPDTLVIGIAPVGGALPADWLSDVEAALRAGLRVVSGLHTRISDHFPGHEKQIREVRHEHPPNRIATGEAMGVDALVVTMVGTDCSSGKMTASVELAMEAKRRGLKAAFVATGQTGIMIGADAGAPLDALVADFVAGATEALVLQAAAKKPDIIFVEGQGNVTHPAYAGVTAGLLHGSFPDALVMCDEPRREFLSLPPGPVRFVKNSARRERELCEAHLASTTQARVVAAALMTRGLDEADYRAEVASAEKELGVAAGDVFRGDTGKLLDAILANAPSRDAKRARYQKGVVG